MEERIIEKTNEKINNILNEDINTNNLDHLYKLSKIRHYAKEDKAMYGNYGNYRGHDHLDRIYDNYGRYEEGKERYGANEDTKKSLRYMLESMEDFARMLRNEASSQEEVEMIRQTAQRISQM